MPAVVVKVSIQDEEPWSSTCGSVVPGVSQAPGFVAAIGSA